ncbi:hypothetical protein AFLA_006415 [Aspergillus flavus NRRL3357]|nr:hypothetical protein AFLA_006415 [Aspergillus flavus NRRL3357]
MMICFCLSGADLYDVCRLSWEFALTTESDADFPVISPCRQTLISEAHNLLIVYLLRERASTASNSPLYIHKPLAAFNRGPRYPTRVGPS